MARYKQKPKVRFNKKIVTLCIILVIVFTPLFVYAFIRVGSEPIALIGAFFGFITAELWKLADLKKDENKKDEVKSVSSENNNEDLRGD